jgi:hypothetical protein
MAPGGSWSVLDSTRRSSVTDFETISVELPSGRSLEGQRETRHAVWLEGWGLAEAGDVIRIQGASWRVDDVQRARIGGQRATRLHVVRGPPDDSPEAGRTDSGSSESGGSDMATASPSDSTAGTPATGREIDRRLRDALDGRKGSDNGGLRYGSDLDALLRLTSRMERLGYRLSYRHVGEAPIAARAEPIDDSRAPLEATGATVAEALCRVCLAALERWEEQMSEEELRTPPRRATRPAPARRSTDVG